MKNEAEKVKEESVVSLNIATDDLLKLFSRKSTRKEYLAAVVGLIALWTGCSHVGIRVVNKDGGIPYESYVGFGREFWQLENFLSLKEDQCACVRIILGNPEPQDKPCMTRGGSFHCTDTSKFVSSLDTYEATRFRGTCIKFGYGSVTVVPIRYREKVVGAIHLAEKGEGSVTLDSVEFIESLTPLVGEAVHRFNLEEDLRLSEEKYRSIFENAIEGIFQLTPDGRFLSANRALAKMFGYENTEEMVDGVEGSRWRWCLVETDCSRLTKLLQERNSAEGFYAQAYRKDGARTWVSINARTVRNEGGIPLYYEGTIEDVSERRRSEEERTRLAIAVEQAFAGTVITDRAGIVQYVNPAFENITGFSREEVVGKAAEILKKVLDTEEGKEGFLPVTARGEIWADRIVSQRKDGNQYESEIRVSAIRDQSDNIINYVIVERDVTKEVRLERQLRQAQKMDAIGTLAGGIAHDFNNILAGIIGFTEMALEDSERESGPWHYMEQVLKAGIRGRNLVHQILAFSRKSDSDRRATTLEPIIEESLALFGASLPPTIELRKKMMSKARILAEPTEMQQVIMNLCTNAAHAMEAKGGLLEVEMVDYVCLSSNEAPHPDVAPGVYVKLSVRDTGCGMESELLDRIFDPFFTTRQVGEGTGLGLSVVHGIVKSHDGIITVTSKPGEGSTFDLYFPVIDGYGVSPGPGHR